MTLERSVQKSLQVARNSLMATIGRRHPDRYSPDEFPMLFVRSRREPGAKRGHRENGCLLLGGADHGVSNGYDRIINGPARANKAGVKVFKVAEFLDDNPGVVWAVFLMEGMARPGGLEPPLPP